MHVVVIPQVTAESILILAIFKWHGVFIRVGNKTTMKDFITFSAALIGSYAAFMGILFLFGKYFFPFYTKEQLERMNAIVTPKQATKRKELKRKAIEQINK